eukprot:1675151-Amphidinium_carterae.1
MLHSKGLWPLAIINLDVGGLDRPCTPHDCAIAVGMRVDKSYGLLCTVQVTWLEMGTSFLPLDPASRSSRATDWRCA